MFDQLISDFKKSANPDRAGKDKRYHKYPHDCYGLTSPEFHSLMKRYRPDFKRLKMNDVWRLAASLVHVRFEESVAAATYLLHLHKDTITPKDFSKIDKIYQNFISWSTVDDFCSKVFQPLLFVYPKKVLDLVKKWNISKDVWKRRASIVVFTRKVGESGKFTDVALGLCDRLIDAPEDLIRKAIGWALKDSLRGNREKVLKYIKQIRQRGVPAVITLYAIRDLKGADREAVLSICKTKY